LLILAFPHSLRKVTEALPSRPLASVTLRSEKSQKKV
jgi:hypothetical protein